MDERLRSTLLCTILILLVGTSQSISPADHDVKIEATPSTVHVGLTSHVALNCTIPPQLTGFSTVTRLGVLKHDSNVGNSTSEMAFVTTISPFNVTVNNAHGAQVLGQLLPNGESFLSFEWAYPSDQVAGMYKCDVRGLNHTGHPVARFTTVEVKTGTIDLATVVEKIKDMEIAQDQQKKRLNDLENKVNMAKEAIIEFSSSEFRGHRYLLAGTIMRNIDVARVFCQLYGGHIAEIDDQAEYKFIADFLQNNKIYQWVALGATDLGDEGTWTFYSGYHVTYFKWGQGQPEGGTGKNCLYLAPNPTRDMFDGECHFHLWSRFLCEVPTPYTSSV